MIAKLIVWDVDREASTRRMLRALDEYEIDGPQDPHPVPQGAAGHRPVGHGETCRDLMEDKKWLKGSRSRRAGAGEDDGEEKVERDYAVEVSGRKFDVKVIGAASAPTAPPPRPGPPRARPSAPSGEGAGGGPDEITSPLQGNMWKVNVKQGDTVEEGQLICIIEAMKMENEITAHKAGTIGSCPSRRASRSPPATRSPRSPTADPAAACRPARRRLVAAGAGDDRHPVVDRRAGAAHRRDRRATSARRSARSGWRVRCWPASPVAVSLLIGPLIDRIGVRPLLVAGAALALAGAGVTAAAPSLALFYAAHAVTGAAWPACSRPASPAWRPPSATSDGAWAMGYVVGAQSLAWIVGNPLIGLLADAGVAAGLPGAGDRGADRAGRRADLAAHRAPARPRGGAVARAWRRDARALGAPLGDRRAGGLLGLDRRAHLRRAPSTSRRTTWTRRWWARCWRSARWCSSSPR